MRSPPQNCYQFVTYESQSRVNDDEEGSPSMTFTILTRAPLLALSIAVTASAATGIAAAASLRAATW